MKPYSGNPRRLTRKRADRLRDTLQRLGDLGGIVHNLETDEVIGGNQRTGIMAGAEIVITEQFDAPDAQGTVALGYVVWKGNRYAYRAVRWDADTAREANIAANVGAGEWDWDALSGWDASELQAWGFDADQLQSWNADAGALAMMLEFDRLAGGGADDGYSQNNGGGPGELWEMELPKGVPDTIWPSDNAFDIPVLDITRQADAFDLPIETWGAKKRGTAAGTLHFYTTDDRFSGIWQRPDHPLQSGAVNMIEPNFSLYKDFPMARAIWETYRKRWLARYWQSQGVRIFVDLNVNPAFYDINMLGVPKGWRAYATRGPSQYLNYTEQELEIAKAHAGGPVLFMVYGGGKAVRDWCKARAGDGVVWVAEDMDRGKGRYLDELGSKQEVGDGE